MKIKRIFQLILFCLFPTFSLLAQANGEKVFLDENGIIRWMGNNKEISLFGANYCLPSASDYRAAGYVGMERKKMIEEDMLHFARMGWDGLRLCFWGDFENTDNDGNLKENDHLDLLDYLIAKAKERGISMLLSPIVTYSSIWPDAMQDTSSVDGISVHYDKSELGLNKKAIAVQTNYLKQLLNHVNPYTGIAIKNEPSILFIEMINEPWHHSNDREASVHYINKLVDAVKSTGCKKLLFHNVSQDFGMGPHLEESKIDGVSFAWYPSGLVSGHTLDANYLPAIDSYELMRIPELAKKAKLVYEFDQPDLMTNYMYPAMTRTFRSVGAQFAAMFAYDMLATAPYNLAWQTHYLNMVYTPAKAVSAIIASKVMDEVPLGKEFQDYPFNTSFEPFKLDYETNHSEMLSDTEFIYAGNTCTIPANKNSLEQIIGFGSSPIVEYEGKGIYFLDKISESSWRLEVYPDAVFINDPYATQSPDKVVSRAISRKWPMKVDLEGLGDSYTVFKLNSEWEQFTKAKNGEIEVLPGLYILTSNSNFSPEELPSKIGNIALKEFIAPEIKDNSAVDIKNISPKTYLLDQPLEIKAEVYSGTVPDKVTAYIKEVGKSRYAELPLEHIASYTYKAEIPSDLVRETFIEYSIAVDTGENSVTFPGKSLKKPTDWNFYESQTYKAKIVNKDKGLSLVNPLEDASQISATRTGNMLSGIFKLVPVKSGGAAFRLQLPIDYDKNLEDYTIAVPVKQKLLDKKELLNDSGSLSFNLRGKDGSEQVYVTVVDNMGQGWTKQIQLNPQWQEMELSAGDFEPSKVPILPTGYPGRWNYWTKMDASAIPSMNLELANIEWLQFSLRNTENSVQNSDGNSWVEIKSVRIKNLMD